MKHVLLIAALFCVIKSVSLNANWAEGMQGELASGGWKTMGKTDQVALLDEKLDIFLYKGYAHVKVKYLFHNTGSGIDISGGFPSVEIWKKNEISDYSISCGTERLKYQVVKGETVDWYNWVKEMEWQSDEDKPRLNWYVSKISFQPGEKKTVSIEYLSGYHSFYGGMDYKLDGSFGTGRFNYLLNTGSSWKGPIAKGSVRIIPMGMDPAGIRITPGNRFTYGNGVYAWNFEKLEPGKKDNIEVDMNTGVKYRANLIFIDEHRSQSTPGNKGEDVYYSEVAYPTTAFYFNWVPVVARASSQLKPVYAPSRAIDRMKDTAWIEGKPGEGMGEFLDLELGKEREVDEIGIIPGYNKSREIYYRNNRISKLEVVLNGEKSIIANIPDHQYSTYDIYQPAAYHFIDVRQYPKKVKKIRLIVRGVHRGADNDTGISEVMVRKKLSSKPDLGGGRGVWDWIP